MLFHATKRVIRSTALVSVLFTAGCATIGDALVWPHQNSGVRNNELVCLYASVPMGFLPPPLLAPIVGAGAGFLIDQTAKAIDRESKRYKATYSARLSDYLLYHIKSDQTTQRVTGFRLVRYAGTPKVDQCQNVGDGSPEPTLIFDADFEMSMNLEAIRIVPTHFSMNKAKAKVSAMGGELQVNVQVTLSAVAQTKDGSGLVNIAQIDYPMGTINLNERIDRTRSQLTHLASGWYALPSFKQPRENGKFVPFTLTVTVIEADDLGDVIAKGATTLAEQRSKILPELLKALGLQSN